MRGCVLVTDQGATSTREIVFDANAEATATARKEFPQVSPRAASVDHDPEEFAPTRRLQRSFAPSMPPAERDSRYRRWPDAVARAASPRAMEGS